MIYIPLSIINPDLAVFEVPSVSSSHDAIKLLDTVQKFQTTHAPSWTMR